MKRVTLFMTVVSFILLVGVVYAGTLNGTITGWKSGKENPLGGATVIIGKDIWLQVKGADDIVRNSKKIAAKAQTNDAGRFTVNIPNGTYTIILWKAGYIPVTGKVIVPGNYRNSISLDTQVGSSGRHRNLRFQDN